MKLSQACWQTFKEVPKEAEIPSHQLMLRAGLIQKSGSGLYQYLPFALRVIQKIERIVRQELDRIGSQELLMSMVTPGELWKESGRWDLMENLMVQFLDRGGKDLCLSPTNEETVTDVFRKIVKSYKQLPVSLYQINTKFRDEIRPRFGLMRGREFIMKDAYTFHQNKECLDQGYQKFYDAYARIFERMGLEFSIVEADAGAMGSRESKTHEFQVIADTGEDDIVYSENYAANIERAQTKRVGLEFLNESELKEVLTKGMKTIKDVCLFLNSKEHHSLKSLVYNVTFHDDTQKTYLLMLLGDDELNEVKLKNHLNAKHVHIADDKTMKSFGLIKGFIGPLNVSDLNVIYDDEIKVDGSYVVGANKLDYHLAGFSPKRDGGVFSQLDLRMSKIGDVAENGEVIKIKKGIEVGHIFQLGDKYTKAMKVQIINDSNKHINPLMGCYGIGVTRTMAASIEQNHDENGIIWPMPIAPYQVHFVAIAKSDEVKELSESLYKEMLAQGIEVLFDDRSMGPGGKFKDADLLGLPLRVTLGERDYKESGLIEIKHRKHSGIEQLNPKDLVEVLLEKIRKENEL